MSSEIRRKLGG